MTNDEQLYATAATGLESLLARELSDMGADPVRIAGSGVRFGGGLPIAYRACLCSRVANRILWPVHSAPAGDPEALYRAVREVDWSAHLDVDGSFAIDFLTARSGITHSRYGVLKSRDAVVDQFRERYGRRPDVDRETPDVRINLYLYKDRLRVAIDLSGSSLHRRGYRDAAGVAPLKENLAAALLLAADWPAHLEAGSRFVDPMCGSGTLLIEAAMIARRQAPGLGRDYFGFLAWKGHDEVAWQREVSAASERVRACPVSIVGFDRNPESIELARRALASAELEDCVSVHARDVLSGTSARLGRGDTSPSSTDVSASSAVCDAESGLLLSNPPYGHRLTHEADFHARLGRALSVDYPGWTVGLFTASDTPVSDTGLPLTTILNTRNGGIDCELMVGKIPSMRSDATTDTKASSNGHIDIEPFENRVAKNLRSLKGWRRQAGIQAFRVYDADLPEFAVAIDVYDCESRHVVVQEYRAPQTVNRAVAEDRLAAVMRGLPTLLDVAPEQLYGKRRERQRGSSQYRRDADASPATAILEERGCRFELEFEQSIDTGLFLDHRPVRRLIGERADGKRFLNLFAYTASATVAAIVGGANESVSVDLSARACERARHNIALNGGDPAQHVVIRSDVLKWLDAARGRERFELILLDPPTFSNSTDVDDWNLQRDHYRAIEACMACLAPDGLLLFSNNFRRFRLDERVSKRHGDDWRVEDRSHWSIDRDFKRNSRIHQCWFIEHARRN